MILCLEDHDIQAKVQNISKYSLNNNNANIVSPETSQIKPPKKQNTHWIAVKEKVSDEESR